MFWKINWEALFEISIPWSFQADAAEDNLEFGRLLEPMINNVTFGDESQVYDTRFSLEVLLPHDLSMYYRYRYRIFRRSPSAHRFLCNWKK